MANESFWDALGSTPDPAMPAIDHLSNRGSANLHLDLLLVGLQPDISEDERHSALFVDFVRLTDKALREYDAARTLVTGIAKRDDEMPLPHALRFYALGDLATDHMENCVDATHRALLYVKPLRNRVIGPNNWQWPNDAKAVDRLNDIRDAIAHADAKILGECEHPRFRGFDPLDPKSLTLDQFSITIGGLAPVTYEELVQLLTFCHQGVELLRKVPTGVPSDTFVNFRTRTERATSVRTAPTPPTFTATVATTKTPRVPEP